MRNGVGIKIKKIKSLIRKTIHNSETFKNNEELTNVIGWTIGFISRRNECGIQTYQKDVENEFNKKVILTFDKVEERLLEGFSIEEKEQLFDYLLRLEKNLEKEGDL